jgi:uncharacterized protein YjbJ (UPF0337 family)
MMRGPNKNEVVGVIERARGSVKEVVGSAVGNRRLAAEGKRENARGKMRQTIGKARRKVGETVDTIVKSTRR